MLGTPWKNFSPDEEHPPPMPPTVLLPETLFWGTGGDVAGQAWLGALISPHVLQA